MATRFIRTSTCVLDSTGYGTATVACPDGTRWTVDTTTVSTSTAVLQPQASTYFGTGVSPGAFIEGTYSGDRDTSDTTHRLHGGEALTVEWTGGDPGATATLRLSGMQEP